MKDMFWWKYFVMIAEGSRVLWNFVFLLLSSDQQHTSVVLLPMQSAIHVQLTGPSAIFITTLSCTDDGRRHTTVVSEVHTYATSSAASRTHQAPPQQLK
jgi:hypothetical protein